MIITHLICHWIYFSLRLLHYILGWPSPPRIYTIELSSKWYLGRQYNLVAYLMENSLHQRCALKCFLRRPLTWFWNSINVKLPHTCLYTYTPTHANSFQSHLASFIILLAFSSLMFIDYWVLYSTSFLHINSSSLKYYLCFYCSYSTKSEIMEPARSGI